MKTELRPGGIAAAFSTPFFLGMAPIFGKLAISAGADPFTVAALRTLVAILLLWTVYLLFFRKYIYIYPAGLMGCVVIGVINGIGSLFYYGGLGLLDASLAQLLNGMYLAFAVLLSHIGGQRADKRTLIRVALAIMALFFLTGFGQHQLNWVGVGLMLGNAMMFAGTVILSQYVLYEMPAPTMTLYTVTTMGVIVGMVWLAVGRPIDMAVIETAIPPVIVLGITTALARLAMFAGVKVLGGMQTAIFAVAEIAVALTLAFVILGDRLTPMQTVGVVILMICLLMIRQKDLLTHGYNPNALIVANMSDVQFQRIAFHRAFGTQETDNEAGTMAALTTQEMLLIRKMMGVQSTAVDPFPIGRGNQLLASLPPDLFETQEVEIPAELLANDSNKLQEQG